MYQVWYRTKRTKIYYERSVDILIHTFLYLSQEVIPISRAAAWDYNQLVMNT